MSPDRAELPAYIAGDRRAETRGVRVKRADEKCERRYFKSGEEYSQRVHEASLGPGHYEEQHA